MSLVSQSHARAVFVALLPLPHTYPLALKTQFEGIIIEPESAIEPSELNKVVSIVASMFETAGLSHCGSALGNDVSQLREGFIYEHPGSVRGQSRRRLRA